MAQSGYTPILIYASGTATNVPLAANMTSSASGAELALNYADGKLYYKNSSGVVTLLASATTVTNSFSAGTTGLTPSTATTGAVTLAGTLVVGNGGTGLTTLATGSLTYGAGTSAFSTLAIGTAGQILTVNSGATAPQWSTLSGVAVTTFSAGTTGFTPSSATAGAVTLAGTLATTNGGTGLTSFTSGGVVYASSTSALATGSLLSFDGSRLGVGTSSPSTYGKLAVVGGNGTGSTIIASYGGTSAGDYGLLVLGTGTTAKASMNVDSTSNNVRFDTRGNTADFYWVSGASYSEGMRLTSTGLGIGTTSPSVKLEVAGSAKLTGTSLSIVPSTATSTAYVVATNTGGNFFFGIDSSAGSSFGIGAYGRVLYSSAAYPMAFFTNDLERMRISSAGYLGIGTTAPNFLVNISTGSTSSIIQPTAGSYGLYVQQNTSGSTGGIYIQDGASNSGYSLFIADNNNAARFVVGPDGSVGVGTSGPNSLLQVLGTTNSGYATSNAIVNAAQAISNSGALWSGSSLRLTANMGGAVNFTGRGSELVFGADNGNFGGGGGFPQANLGAITAISENGNAVGLASSMLFYTSVSNNIYERMRITSAGNVGIGTTTPASSSGVALVVYDASTPRIRLTSATTGQASTDGAEFSLSGSDLYIENREAQNIVFYAGSERARIDTSGNFLVGSTSTSGSVSNTKILLGGVHRSFSGSASAPTSAYTTLFTAPTANGSYIVTVYLSANDVNNYQSVVIVSTQGGSSTKVNVLVSSGLFAFQMSGYSLQCSQSSGSGQTIYYEAIRIGA